MTGARRVRHAPERAEKLNAAVGEQMPTNAPLRPAEKLKPAAALLPAAVAVGLLVYAIGWMP